MNEKKKNSATDREGSFESNEVGLVSHGFEIDDAWERRLTVRKRCYEDRKLSEEQKCASFGKNVALAATKLRLFHDVSQNHDSKEGLIDGGRHASKLKGVKEVIIKSISHVIFFKR